LRSKVYNMKLLTVVDVFTIIIRNNFSYYWMRLLERRVVAALRQYGYKLTPKWPVVILTVASKTDHFTTVEIYEMIHKHHPVVWIPC
jgi:hypothetical protein